MSDVNRQSATLLYCATTQSDKCNFSEPTTDGYNNNNNILFMSNAYMHALGIFLYNIGTRGLAKSLCAF